MSRRKKQSEGLGDTVEKIIHFTGLQHFVDGKDCGCDERKQKLNEMFPYRFKARCLTEDEYNQWTDFQLNKSLTLNSEQIKFVCDLYASVFNRQVWYPCSGCVKEMIAMIDRLDKVYETYKTK
jgi:hypothetical protein